MPKGKPFPPEPSTRPDVRRVKRAGAASHSRPVPRRAADRSAISTLPPPPGEEGEATATGETRISKERPVDKGLAAATVDEVTADLTQDSRRERED
jgi:hypothetical protein